LADLITYTKSPKAIEAYGYVVGQIAKAWGTNTAGEAAAYQNNPMWDVMPRLPDGKYLSASQIKVDVSNSTTVALTATGGDSLLAVVGSGTATLTGGSGGTDLLFGGSGPTTLIAGTGNDYLFAGKGATTFIDNIGDDYMKGGSGADTFTFADTSGGHDTVVGFKTGTDTLMISANLLGGGGQSAATLIAGADVVNGSTVLHLGPNYDVTISGVDTPSTLTGSIVIY
jgi:Ca2+-binding RTX toxin-like protein